MTELINKLEIKKIYYFTQKMQQATQKIDIFCSAIMLQAWRRMNYVFNKKEIHSTLKKTAGQLSALRTVLPCVF
ncbi:MAG: hypothetical protein AYP45_18325 [Candidatus Brocadia carolinensis]|uniref:Uncharacterized protein n=1 Tax=Candidatus Brocadia carolinensis TaxID=1004156 RepID=A0A1V4ANZ1_9BACT|nr:MAG: hypothetical protein AYP45_18325 [Candidatus Brocadia caroliniensis]